MCVRIVENFFFYRYLKCNDDDKNRTVCTSLLSKPFNLTIDVCFGEILFLPYSSGFRFAVPHGLIYS
jgi:hypothetical protein